MHKFRLGMALVLAAAMLLATVPPAHAGIIDDCPGPVAECIDYFPGTGANFSSSAAVPYTGGRLIIGGSVGSIPKECFMPNTYARNRFPKQHPTYYSKEKAMVFFPGWDQLYACWQAP